MSVEIKICGLTRLEDVQACARLGVEAIGLNFWPGSPRCVDLAFCGLARAHFQGELVAVVVDADAAFLHELLDDAHVDYVQLHGSETADALKELLPRAYKAVGIRSANDVERARRFPGARLLVDAPAAAMPGGTGHTFEWPLVESLAQERHLTLAGGLRAHNVAAAIQCVRPARVDVASGVESEPGVKDPAKLAAFVDAVRA